AQIDSIFTQRCPNRRRRRSLPPGHLKLRRSNQLLCHSLNPEPYNGSICQCSNSNEVGRPKILMITLTRPLASVMLSTSPSNFSHVSWFILPLSPFFTWIFGRGASPVFPSVWEQIWAIPGGASGGARPTHPVNPPPPAVSRTKYHVSSLISICTTR